jgi:hypothetical protein
MPLGYSEKIADAVPIEFLRHSQQNQNCQKSVATQANLRTDREPFGIQFETNRQMAVLNPELRK